MINSHELHRFSEITTTLELIPVTKPSNDSWLPLAPWLPQTMKSSTTKQKIAKANTPLEQIDDSGIATSFSNGVRKTGSDVA